MNKLLLLLFFLTSTLSGAQDSIVVAEKKTVSSYSEKDIKVDSSEVARPKFSPKFKEKYKEREFQYEVKVGEEKGVWDRFVDWLKYWLKNLFGLSDVSDNAINITFRVVASVIVLFVVYLIVKAILNKEGNWIFGKSTNKKIINYSDIDRNIHEVDFEKLIASTLKSGNHRLVIRYYYLWLLKKMSEKNIIDWNPEKTNSDYYYEIKSEALKNDFTYVSYLYNYIWYGEFDITPAHFESIKRTFETTLHAVK